MDHIVINGKKFSLGNNPAPLKYQWKRLGADDRTRVIPRGEWDALIDAYEPGPGLFTLTYVHDQNGYGMCFPKGTMIRMGDGTQRPIEQVQVLDEVLTAAGNVKRVLRTMVRKANELYRVQVWGNRHLRCTAEHPILTRRGFVKAADLKTRDMVAMPRYLPRKLTMIQTADYLEDRRIFATRDKIVRSRVYSGIPGKTASTVIVHRPPDVIDLSPDFGRIIGFFLSEGCTSLGKVTWAFNKTEEHTYAAELASLIGKVFGAQAKTRLSAQNCCIVTLHGVHWAKLFEKWCSLGAAGKRLHADLASGPESFLASVLSAWTDGDGIGDGHNGGVTISHSLAMSMFDIANALGYRPTIETLDPKTYGQVKSRQRRYVVRWGQNANRGNDKFSMLDDTHMWRRVDGVVREDFDGWVYNFEVEDEHTYVAESIGVHNCNASATVSAMETSRMRAGLPMVKLSGGDLYGRINGGRDQGSMLEDGLAESQNGVAEVSEVPYLDWRGPRNPSTRKANKVLEYYIAPTFGEAMSGILQGFDLISGVMWHDNFNPAADGWCPDRGRGSGGGHAVHGYKPARKGSKYGIWHKNSWTEDWGLDGHGIFPESWYSGPVGGWWLVRVTTANDADKIPAPVN